MKKIGIALLSIAVLSLIVAVPVFSNNYAYNFEKGAAGWEATGMWHIVNEKSHYKNANSGVSSFWYGNELTGNYDSGTANSGRLISPPINLKYSTNSSLTFWYWYQTESMGKIYDQRFVQIREVGNIEWEDLGQLYDDQMGQWLQKNYDISKYNGKVVEISFYFDMSDELANDYRGWYIDDVEIQVEKN
ncbi:MAG: Immune inhibitor A peptidase M6 [Candidatus Methanofastidiosum methylothiophilum]|uniref:Immune inhibitor A peptidase M6 n=1 Tax=Candidatus Methanofastidiosum methylothiophilum TaxID=1705564 RepID=A0A150J186_9EURY|nr:MAG: Immune inhibitor A peptidase M6 [Candidatus Methanofastidiosum methylthiophilus]KYC46537.1 MAG: Immune inhibitor A peptidase M6 [Candidatus Methanofastidiosum methylthiophilus]KYC51013.1 MAG: Immune inhibitor A peptidase M6 [Candidatus Methanofastidiosum methylthiophilus]